MVMQRLLGGGGSPARVGRQGHRDYVRVTSGDAAYNTAAEVIALITGTAHADFLKIWQQTISAQTRKRWGYGSPALPHNQGYMWFCSLDTGTDFDVGILRLVEADAREWHNYVCAEIPDESLHGTTVTTLTTATPTDRNTMVPLPEKVEYPRVKEDSKLLLTYALLVAATTHDNAGFVIPVTTY